MLALFGMSATHWHNDDGLTTRRRLAVSDTPGVGLCWPNTSLRSYHSVAWYGNGGDNIVLFGGANCTGRCHLYADTWIFNVVTATWTEVACQNVPATRYHQTLIRNPTTQQLLTFGGESYQPRYMYHNAVEQLQLSSGPGLPSKGTEGGSISAFLLATTGLLVVGLFAFRGALTRLMRTTRRPTATASSASKTR